MSGIPSHRPVGSWSCLVLRAAAVYNLVWGLWVIALPLQLFAWLQIEPPKYIAIWQGMGMVIGVYGLAYWWASYDPVRHWPIVMVGLLGKTLGPIGFLYSWFNGSLPAGFGWMLLSNDLLWWIPFGLILAQAHQANWPLTDTE